MDMDVHANKDVLQHGERLIEANVLEGPCKSRLHHVVRASWARDAEPSNQTHVPGGANDAQQECAHKAEEGQDDRCHARVEASIAANCVEEIGGEEGERRNRRHENKRLAPFTTGRLHQGDAIKFDLSLRWRVDPGDHVEEGGLPGAVRPDDRRDHPLRDLKVNGVHCNESTEASSNCAGAEHRRAHFAASLESAKVRMRRRAG